MKVHRVNPNDYPAIMFTTTDRMEELLRLMDPLDDELDNLRSAENYNQNIIRIRELRFQLGKLEREYWDISMEINKDYHNMKPVWKGLS